jgi:NADH dehydrogenase
MAGQIAELAHRTLTGNFRRIDPSRSRVVLLDAASSVLGSFGQRLSAMATRQLAELGVEVQLDTNVVNVDATGIDVVDEGGHRHRIESMCKVWAAGVRASPLGAQLAAASGANTDRAGRVEVNPDCTLPGHPEVFVVGDMMALDGLPGVAQVAIQSGEHAADQIGRRLRGDEKERPFRYKDKGAMATVSRFHAVASIGRLRLGGFPAWVLWLAVHLFYLVGFKNRLTTVLHWAYSFIGRGRAERVITEHQVRAAAWAPDNGGLSARTR